MLFTLLLFLKDMTFLFCWSINQINDGISELQILPLFRRHKVIHFNKTDARLANNGLSLELQRLRCRVNYQALRFTPQLEALGNKLISILKKSGFFVVLHLRYEMDMLSFSGCTHGCSVNETEELTNMRLVPAYTVLGFIFSRDSIYNALQHLNLKCPPSAHLLHRKIPSDECIFFQDP